MTIIGDLVWCGSDDPQIRVFRLEFGQFDEEASEVKLSYYGAVDRSHTGKAFDAFFLYSYDLTFYRKMTTIKVPYFSI